MENLNKESDIKSQLKVQKISLQDQIDKMKNQIKQMIMGARER